MNFLHIFFYFFIIHSPPKSTLFPYTTLFRSLEMMKILLTLLLVLLTIIFFDVITFFFLPNEYALNFNEYREDFQRDTLADRKSTRLNSSHITISYAVFCLKKKKKHNIYKII